jgi:hypothetical protein
LQNEKIQEEAQKQNTIVIQLQNDQRAAESRAEREKLQEERDLAQGRVDYFSATGDMVKAFEYERVVRRLDEYLNPSKAPSIQSDRPRRRRFWKLSKH